MIFREPNGTFCNQYGFISGRVTPTTGSFAKLEEAEKQLYADRPLAQKVQAREKPPAHAPADRDEAEHRYQVVVYHHLENGMDEKLEYATPEEAEQAARGYLDGTMEADGFAYEGAAVYDLLEKKWLRVIGDFPTLELPAAKEGTEPKPPAAPMPTQEGTEKAAEYLFDQERIVVFQSPSGKFYNHYGYDVQSRFSNVIAGGFDTFEEAEKALYSHRHKAERV